MKKIKIIIVEDDPMISEIYQKKFSESGFEVFAADSGDQALVLAKAEDVDVVLLDLILPRMSGFEVIENLRNGKFDPEIKIIISSNLNQKEDREKARKLGANGFIVKAEHTPSDLVDEVKRLLYQFDEGKKNEERLNGLSRNNARGNAKKILMIEDEEIFDEMFGGKLRQDGYTVTFTSNGVWGMNEALKNDYDLFIIDMVMPGMTGEEIITRLKMEEKTKGIPIIALSASVDESAEKKIREMGANEFFFKTKLIPSELSNKVSDILAGN